jgi:divinyl protochlorophyllide a 8-vinyl-reductase
MNAGVLIAERPASHGVVSHEGARIDPNAVTRLAEALLSVEGEGPRARVFASAGCAGHLAHPPESMVDERDVAALHHALRAELGEGRARTVGWLAGRRTADYLLAHRIPTPVQRLLHVLPAWAASRVLAAAIGRHAWTFAGSGRFSVRHGRPTLFVVEDGPLAREGAAPGPRCDYYAATFERLYSVLVHPHARVREVACAAAGAPACVFAITW